MAMVGRRVGAKASAKAQEDIGLPAAPPLPDIFVAELPSGELT